MNSTHTRRLVALEADSARRALDGLSPGVRRALVELMDAPGPWATAAREHIDPELTGVEIANLRAATQRAAAAWQRVAWWSERETVKFAAVVAGLAWLAYERPDDWKSAQTEFNAWQAAGGTGDGPQEPHRLLREMLRRPELASLRAALNGVLGHAAF